MKSRLIVVALIEKNGKVLLGKKAKDIGPYPNTWHMPGGGVDLENETLEEAMRRELKEETGLEVLKMNRTTFDEDYENNKHGEKTHYVFLVFHVEPKDINAKASDDIVELKWFDKSELKNLPLTRPGVKYLKDIGWL